MAPSSGSAGGPADREGRWLQKGRTRRAILAAAARLVASGQTPTVAEVADAAEVSRRTAYRYFPSQEQLLVEAALEGLRPAIESAAEHPAPDESGDDVEARLDRVVVAMMRNARASEPLLRTMIRLTVGSSPVATESGPVVPRRGYRRIEWLTMAIEPARERLGKRRFDRLIAALTVCVGIDALIVLRDLCQLTDDDADNVTRWTARSLLQQSLASADAARLKREARRETRRETKRGRPSGD